MSVLSNFYHWGVPVVDVLKTIPYRESSQIGKRRFVAKLLSVWCGSVSYPRAVECVVWYCILSSSCCVCGVVVCPVLELLCVWCGSVSYPRAVECVVW
jgi:hypothetical protein